MTITENGSSPPGSRRCAPVRPTKSADSRPCGTPSPTVATRRSGATPGINTRPPAGLVPTSHRPGQQWRGSALCGYTPEVRNELAQSRDHGPTTDVRKSGEERGVAFSPTLQEDRGNDEGPCVLRWRDSSKDHQAAERVCDVLEIESLARAAGRRARYARVRAAGGSPGQI